MERRNLVTALAVTALIVAVPSALAATGGNGNGHRGGSGSGTTTSAWVSVSPNPAASNGTAVYLSGCGYDVAPVTLKIRHSAGYTQEYSVGMWATGCMFNGYFLTRETGTYTIDVYQASGRNRHPTLVLKASTTLTVQ